MSAALEVAGWPAPAARLEPRQLAPGESGRIVITFDVPDGCHVQSNMPAEPFLIPTTVDFDEAPGIALGAAMYPDGEVERFDWTSVTLAVYRGTIEIVVPFEVEGGARPRPVTIAGRVRAQGCTETTCLPPTEWPVVAHLEIAAAETILTRVS